LLPSSGSVVFDAVDVERAHRGAQGFGLPVAGRSRCAGMNTVACLQADALILDREPVVSCRSIGRFFRCPRQRRRTGTIAARLKLVVAGDIQLPLSVERGSSSQEMAYQTLRQGRQGCGALDRQWRIANADFYRAEFGFGRISQ
jgi:hypothetical protein